jgi:hypothetical protein
VLFQKPTNRRKTMGRPSIVSFADFNDEAAVSAVESILKTEKNTTIDALVARLRKRVTVAVEGPENDLYTARVTAAVNTIAATGKITVTDNAVAVVPGKRGRPMGSKNKTTAAVAEVEAALTAAANA